MLLYPELDISRIAGTPVVERSRRGLQQARRQHTRGEILYITVLHLPMRHVARALALRLAFAPFADVAYVAARL